MKLPRVLVFTIIYEAKEYCLDEFLKHSKAINYPNIRHIFVDNSTTTDFYKKLKGMGLEAYHVERGANSREALARSQNFARKIALDENYDYLFSLESDIMCPPDIIQNLMKHSKDIISGVYYIGDKSKGVRVPCITLPKFNEELGAFGTRLLFKEEFPQYLNKGLKQVQAGGMGCTLIYKRVLKRIPFTYDPRFTGHSDIYFFNEAFRKKIPVFVDTDIYCEHDNINWDTVDDR